MRNTPPPAHSDLSRRRRCRRRRHRRHRLRCRTPRSSYSYLERRGRGEGEGSRRFHRQCQHMHVGRGRGGGGFGLLAGGEHQKALASMTKPFRSSAHTAYQLIFSANGCALRGRLLLGHFTHPLALAWPAELWRGGCSSSDDSAPEAPRSRGIERVRRDISPKLRARAQYRRNMAWAQFSFFRLFLKPSIDYSVILLEYLRELIYKRVLILLHTFLVLLHAYILHWFSHMPH